MMEKKNEFKKPHVINVFETKFSYLESAHDHPGLFVQTLE